MQPLLTTGVAAVKIYKREDDVDIEIRPSTKGAIKGAATGMVIARPFGPAGMAFAAGIGGVLGYILSDD